MKGVQFIFFIAFLKATLTWTITLNIFELSLTDYNYQIKWMVFIFGVVQSPWSVIMLLTVVSTTVQDISEIIWTMMSKTSNCLVIEVIELLYLLATMFWMMKSEARINSGYEMWLSFQYRLICIACRHEKVLAIWKAVFKRLRNTTFVSVGL